MSDKNAKGAKMSVIVTEAMAMLAQKLDGRGFDGTARFVLEGEGAFMIDASGVHAGDDAADVTLSASPRTFKAILDGDLNPTAAFMTGKLSVDGDMGMAMKLASILG